jgi:hypothetical protein
MPKFSVQHTSTAIGREISISTQPGSPLPPKAVTTLQLTRAPTISTSPWAKLIRLMMP